MGDTIMSVRERKSLYEEWAKEEGIPVHLTYGGTDLATITDLRPWRRMGGRGAFIINPDTWKGMCDAYICEIPPRGSLLPQRHMYEEQVLIMEGHGATTVWLDERRKQTFEWAKGDYFAIPLNANFQHFNGSDGPAQILAVTAAPLMINYFHNRDFIFNNSYVFTDRFAGQEEFFNPAASRQYAGPTFSTVLEANFVQDIAHIEMPEWKERGKGGTNLFFELANSTFMAHASEMPAGSYKKAHRHLATGWFGIILRGKGFSLTWKDDTKKWSAASEKRKIDWHENCVLGYPDPWYHQHFNLGPEPARYLAVHFGSQRFPGFVWTDLWKVAVSTSEGGDQIEYSEEDPEILALYEEEMKREGLEVAPLGEWL